jgi:hypothetical protein
MQFVGFFIVQMMIKKLILGIFKLWNVFFIRTIMCMPLSQTQKKENNLQHVDCDHATIVKKLEE